MGGYDKKLDFEVLKKYTEKSVTTLIIFGGARRKILKVFKGCNLRVFKTLNLALDSLWDYVKEGDTVLFSPACASFDEFENYEERGKFFKRKILDMVERVEKSKK